MDFSFTPEQEMLRESLARYFADTYSFPRRQAMVRSAQGWAPGAWRGLADDLGVLGAGFDPDVGGLGGGAVEHLVVMEEIGRALAIEPYLETAVLGGGLLRRWDSPRAREWIERIVGGEVRLAFAHLEPPARYDLQHVTTRATRQPDGWVLDGLKDAVRGAPFATHLLVTARTSGDDRDRRGVATFLVAADAAGLTLRRYPTVDGSLAADVCLAGVRADTLGSDDGFDALEAAVDEAIAGLCAEAVGVMRRLLADTVEYTKQRRQFDAPIAANQVLQHRMVDMYTRVEQAVSMTYLATLSLSRPPAQRMRAVSAAKVFVAEAARFVGQAAVQLHGGMGMTDELAVSHYFKRATMIESQFGSADHHAHRIESLAPDA
ncbi:MAG TPA: acyl-CoA dehydrogenase family protein [Steroidobacteraceae bacterium]